MKQYYIRTCALLLALLLLAGCGAADHKEEIAHISEPPAVSSVTKEEENAPADGQQSAAEPENQSAVSRSAVVPEESTQDSGKTQPENQKPDDAGKKEPEPEQQPEPEYEITPAKGTIYCTASSVNIRTRPDTTGAVKGYAKLGDSLTMTGKVNNGWYEVSYQGLTLFVSGRCFSETPPKVEETPEEQPAEEKPKDEKPQKSEGLTVGNGIYYKGSGPLVAIDAGHQRKGDSAKEPNGPGSSTMKAKVTWGATGVATGAAEYQLNLDVSLKLRDALLAKGYSVLMIRETNDVNISNAQRAEIANKAGADILVRIHANSADAPSASGTVTLAPSTSNPYCSSIAGKSQKLSQLVVDAMCERTGFRNRGVSITDTMTGINWCKMPVTIVELGFMSNAEEDKAMQTESVQKQLVAGMVAGIDSYFGR